MTDKNLVCWKCGTSLPDMPLPLPRRSKCRACNADLHCCRQCIFYDPTVSNQCREPVAERVNDKQRANFCGYLQPNPEACTAAGQEQANAARSELNALFGLDSEDEKPEVDADSARKKLDDLFK